MDLKTKFIEGINSEGSALKQIFSFNYTPKTIYERNELGEISLIFGKYYQSSIPDNLIIYGSVGCGKTVSIVYLIEQLEQLKEVNTDGVEPTAQVTGLENVLRPDSIAACPEEEMKKLVAMAPEHEDNLVKTRSVF